MKFRWKRWNIENATKHGCSISEVEAVATKPGRGFPQQVGDDKLLVIGRGQGDRFIEVIYLLDDDGTAYVIHAMPLTTRRRRS